jgi:nicotinamidase-related amidase
MANAAAAPRRRFRTRFDEDGMKLLYCPQCLDVIKLRMRELRRCACGTSWGCYLDDDLTAEIGGNAVPIAIENDELRAAILRRPRDGRGFPVEARVLPEVYETVRLRETPQGLDSPPPPTAKARTTGKALLVIDLQNDYFPGGKFPLWNTEATLRNIERAIEEARSRNIPVVIVQHVAGGSRGIAPFFNAGTAGADVHPRILAAAARAPVVVKQFADSFVNTTLEDTLAGLEATELLVCGMMTQNCVTHTAISKSAEKYRVSILADCCTTVSEMLHNIALHALSTRVTVATASEALQS